MTERRLLWGVGTAMWVDPLIFASVTSGICLNYPIFSNLGLCAACVAHFMCHHELWSTSVNHHFSFRYYWRKTLPGLLGTKSALRWRHDDQDGVLNHQPYHCLLNRLFRRRSKKTSKLRVTGLCAVNSPETGEFPAQMASNAENVSIWWRHHGYMREKENKKQG